MTAFKARARTVDMLGRQQIAGVPTAISELFKNAHDAYAERVDVDLYRLEKLIVLRDDGIGMSPRDFEDRWLTLGTDSKVRHGGLKSVTPPAGAAERPISDDLSSPPAAQREPTRSDLARRDRVAAIPASQAGAKLLNWRGKTPQRLGANTGVELELTRFG